MRLGNAYRIPAVLTIAAAFLFTTGFATAQEVRHGSGLRPDGKHRGVEDAGAPAERDIQEPNDALPSHDASRAARTRTNGISWHGGPVMHGTVPVYFIWYGNWSGNTATTLLPNLISDLSGSGYEHINTTYYDSTAHVAGTLALQGQANDNYSQGTALSDGSVQTVVANHCQTLGGCDTSAIYFVLTSADVNETSGFCTQYCGWHTSGTISGKDIKYAFVGNPDRCLSACAQQSTSPNNNAGADGMASIIAHESEEAISDPDLNAWYDSRGQENADKCAWTFGTTSTASNGSLYNFTGASGTKWLIQRNWVNASGGYCAMSY